MAVKDTHAELAFAIGRDAVALLARSDILYCTADPEMHASHRPDDLFDPLRMTELCARLRELKKVCGSQKAGELAVCVESCIICASEDLFKLWLAPKHLEFLVSRNAVDEVTTDVCNCDLPASDKAKAFAEMDEFISRNSFLCRQASRDVFNALGELEAALDLVPSLCLRVGRLSAIVEWLGLGEKVATTIVWSEPDPLARLFDALSELQSEWPELMHSVPTNFSIAASSVDEDYSEDSHFNADVRVSQWARAIGDRIQASFRSITHAKRSRLSAGLSSLLPSTVGASSDDEGAEHKNDSSAEDASCWSKEDYPSQFAKKFDISVSTFRRRVKAGRIRVSRLSSKRIKVHLADLPPQSGGTVALR